MAPQPTEIPLWAQLLLTTFFGLALFAGTLWTYARKLMTPPAPRDGDALVIAGSIADKASSDKLIAAMDKLSAAVDRLDNTSRLSEDRISRAADHVCDAVYRLKDEIEVQSGATTNLLEFIKKH